MIMRIWSLISFLLVILFILHGLFSASMLITFNSVPFSKVAAHTLAILAIVHAIFGIAFSFSPVKVGLKTGRWYLKQNARFWTKRISGLFILLFFFLHLGRYTTTAPDGSFMLVPYDIVSLLLQLGLIIAVATHLAVSIKPGFVRVGVESFKPAGRAMLVVAFASSLVMAFSAFKYLTVWMGGIQ